MAQVQEAEPRPDDALGGDELLQFALSRPADAARMAETLLTRRAPPLVASYSLQALSVAHRELGDGRGSLRFARRALRAAVRSGQAERVVDTRATLGSTLAQLGRSREALDEFGLALADAHGLSSGRVLMRRGGVLEILGRYDEAMADLRRAIPILREHQDVVYLARALTFRALVYLERGQHDRSDQDLAESERLMREANQQLESAVSRHHRGKVAYRSGDLPLALQHFDAAEAMLAEVGQEEAELEADRCRTLLAAGLPDDAVRHAERAVEILSRDTASAHQRAEALLAAASAGLAAGNALEPQRNAESAERLFRAQQRDRWSLRARRVALVARWREGERTAAMLRQAIDLADRLNKLRDPEAADARLLAGRIALDLGRADAATEQLSAAARARHRGPAISRATGWLARALQAEAEGRPRDVLTACRRGLDLLDEHRLTLGATEMRARATIHAVELAAVATRQAARAGDARRLLLWSERSRATTLTAAPVRPPDDEELTAELSALRALTGRIAQARADGQPTTAMEHEQARLEAAVRTRTLRTSGVPGAVADRLDLAAIRAALDDALLVELVEVEGVLHVVTVSPKRASLHTAGTTDTAMAELEFARFGLRRVAVASSDATIRGAMAALRTAAEALEKALLGPVAELINGREGQPVVVIPSGRLHAVPWSLLPCLRHRPVTVAPSVTSWLRARSMPPPRRSRVAMVVGPGLVTGGGEVQEAAEHYADVTLLNGEFATADRALAALDGASLAHVAAHGIFRADNALFSSLQLADGPLTVHDLERLRRPPYRLVLSSCDSGLATTAGADELLGLSSALIGLGTAGLLASVVVVNDEATVPLMTAVHERLRDGASLAAALYAAREELGDADPVLAATGLSFIALGGA